MSSALDHSIVKQIFDAPSTSNICAGEFPFYVVEGRSNTGNFGVANTPHIKVIAFWRLQQSGAIPRHPRIGVKGIF